MKTILCFIDFKKLKMFINNKQKMKQKYILVYKRQTQVARIKSKIMKGFGLNLKNRKQSML